jgi:DNA-binding transcriptional ArsR family regulator
MVYLAERLTATFGALADPTRRAIVARLAAGARTISDLASGFEMTLPAVSKHVRVLEGAGLVRVEKEGRTHWCWLVTKPLRSASAWIEQYGRYWEAGLDRLTKYLEETEAQEEEAERWRKHRRRRTGSGSSGRTRRSGSEFSERGRKRKR